MNRLSLPGHTFILGDPVRYHHELVNPSRPDWSGVVIHVRTDGWLTVRLTTTSSRATIAVPAMRVMHDVEADTEPDR